MKNPIKYLLFIFLSALAGTIVWGQTGPYLQVGGVTLIRAFGANLNGSGIRVGQSEAPENGDFNWEVDPADVAEPNGFITYYTNGLSSSTFPNAINGNSGHADNVGQMFYDPNTGVATNILHVDDPAAEYYFNTIIANSQTLPTGITDAVVNESFSFGALDVSSQQTVDSDYDNYSVQFKTLFVSAACNFSINPTVCAPGTAYNCVSVGVYQGDSSHGPTIDNGRCKPDLVAETPTGTWTETSFSTPLVAGAAAILIQAGRRGDGGSGSVTNAATSAITVKALLINGAVKPADWSNVPPQPLNTNYGAGVMNVFNSYEQLAGGRHGYNYATNISLNAAHPPLVTSAAVPVLNGWDYNTNTSSATNDTVNHYFFNVTNSFTNAMFTLTSTLVWNRHQNKTAINNLALYLYNAANNNLVASSTSVVDNVQHVFIPKLAQGRYDLQVWKAGGANIVTTNETYALAWEIFTESLNMTQSGTNLSVSWPAYPAGFALVGSPTLLSPAWSTNNLPAAVLTNNQNLVYLSATNSVQFFRLQTPDF